MFSNPHLALRRENLYALNVYKIKESVHMPQMPNESNSRMSLRIAAAEKALLIRAAALQRINLTDFVIRTAVDAARNVIDEAEHIELSERDSMRVLDLLENPPKPNEKLMAAAYALPDRT